MLLVLQREHLTSFLLPTELKKTPTAGLQGPGMVLPEAARPLPCKAAQQEPGSGCRAAAELQVTSLVIKNAFGFVSDVFCIRIKDSLVAIAE